NIDALKTLTKLVKLYLSNNKISNIQTLMELVDLEVLSLFKNYIEDIDPLSKLTKLKELDLSDNNIKNVKALSDLTKLEVLDLVWNRVSNIEPLINLKDLREVKLFNNLISRNHWEKVKARNPKIGDYQEQQDLDDEEPDDKEEPKDPEEPKDQENPKEENPKEDDKLEKPEIEDENTNNTKLKKVQKTGAHIKQESKEKVSSIKNSLPKTGEDAKPWIFRSSAGMLVLIAGLKLRR